MLTCISAQELGGGLLSCKGDGALRDSRVLAASKHIQQSGLAAAARTHLVDSGRKRGKRGPGMEAARVCNWCRRRVNGAVYVRGTSHAKLIDSSCCAVCCLRRSPSVLLSVWLYGSLVHWTRCTGDAMEPCSPARENQPQTKLL